jgi:hypothetical protein
MTTCSSCASLIPDDAKFCPQCGAPRVKPTTLSEFEIGKIAALSTIRRDILTWLGGTVTALGVIFAVLGYLGMTEMVKSTVSEQIKKALEKRDEQISKSMQDVFINLGKAQRDQEQISNILIQSKMKLDEAEVQSKTLEIRRKDLIGAITKTEEERLSLESLIRQLNIATFIQKLKYDFYHVRQFSAKAIITFDDSAERKDLFLSHAYHLTVGHANDQQNTRTKFAELDRDGPITLIGDNEKIQEIKMNYVVFGMFDENIYNKHISHFQNLNAAQIRLYTRANSQEDLEGFWKKVKFVNLTIFVNWMPLWQFRFTEDNVVSRDKDERDNYAIRLMAKLPPNSKDLVMRYEELFSDESHSTTPEEHANHAHRIPNSP